MPKKLMYFPFLVSILTDSKLKVFGGGESRIGDHGRNSDVIGCGA